MNKCPRCGGPTISLFTGFACKAECDLPKKQHIGPRDVALTDLVHIKLPPPPAGSAWGSGQLPASATPVSIPTPPTPRVPYTTGATLVPPLSGTQHHCFGIQRPDEFVMVQRYWHNVEIDTYADVDLVFEACPVGGLVWAPFSVTSKNSGITSTNFQLLPGSTRLFRVNAPTGAGAWRVRIEATRGSPGWVYVTPSP